MKRSSRPITQVQIARMAGISQAAVSAILSGSGVLSVSEETRRNVLSIAEKLGYVVRKSSVQNEVEEQSVLIVENEPPREAINESWLESAYQTYLGRLFSAASRYLQERSIGLSVFNLSDAKRFTQWLADSDISGVLWHAQDSDSALLHWVASRFPLVLLNREWKSALPYDAVSIDQEKNILIAAEHLYSLGHRRIAVFGHWAANSVYRRRMSAYRQFVEQRGLRNYEEYQEISDALDIPALEKVSAILNVWKQQGAEAPTALITGDVFALPLLREVRRMGIDVPENLSVVGIDNTSPCSLMEPALTSMEQPLDEMCRVAVDLLMRRKGAPQAPSTTVQIAPNLVNRASVASLLGDRKPLAVGTPLRRKNNPLTPSKP